MVLRTVKALAGGKVQFTSAIRAEYQAGKHSLSLCLGWTAFVRSQFLYPFKDSFLNDCFMGVAENSDIVNIGLHFFLKNVRPYAASCSEA